MIVRERPSVVLDILFLACGGGAAFSCWLARSCTHAHSSGCSAGAIHDTHHYHYVVDLLVLVSCTRTISCRCFYPARDAGPLRLVGWRWCVARSPWRPARALLDHADAGAARSQLPDQRARSRPLPYGSWVSCTVIVIVTTRHSGAFWSICTRVCG